MDEKYWEAPEVEEIAVELIPKYHSHLKDARIAYLFKKKPSKTGNFIILGQMMLTSDVQKKLHGYDFVMLIPYQTWEEMDDLHKKILVDHELCHADYWMKKNGETRWSLRRHDIQEFREIYQRYPNVLEEGLGIELVESSEEEEEGSKKLSTKFKMRHISEWEKRGWSTPPVLKE